MPFIHPTELKKRFPFLAKKSLGQHFLVHRPTLETLAEKILAERPHTILEIGPGPGSLSQLLAPRVKRLILVEKDVQFEEPLHEVLSPFGNAEIHFDDFLKADLPSLLDPHPKPALAVGNLPYNASVAILQRLLNHRSLFDGFFLMFQREVADRLVAGPGGGAYGSLSVYVQMLCEAKIILPIPPSAFDPRPKIHSAVVALRPLPCPRIPDVDLDFFQKVVQAAFNPRRKTLANNLKRWAEGGKKEAIASLLNSLNIDPRRRGETLSLEEFGRLVLALQQ